MEVNIDVLKEEEIDKIADSLLDMYLMHTNSVLISEENLQSMSVKDYIKKTLRDLNQVFFVAKVNNEVAGVIRCEIKETPHYYKEPKEAYLDDLFVIEKYRRQDVATKLIHACIDWGKKNRIALFTCKIWTFNKPAIQLIERNKFKKDFSFYSLIVKN